MFERVLIANRGEIARRVIRTLDRLGIGSVAVCTPGDRHAPFVREAEHVVAIPSYLDIDAVVRACADWGADALHPGYGFLSENPALARACADAGVDVHRATAGGDASCMGNKLRAKETAAAAGVPVVASFGEDEARTAGDDVYPLLVKAAAGGGGRGMRVVQRPEDLDAALASARREAQAGFGDDRVFIERFLPRARHIEVQVIADAHGNVLHLGERECSLQRRHQKVIEESPSPVVSPELRDAPRRRGGGAGPRRRLRQRRHGRVHRRLRGPRRALLPGDERAPPGRAPRHRARHRAGPGGAAAARRRRGAARAHPGRGHPGRPRDRGADQRRGRRARTSSPPPAACSPTPGPRVFGSTTRSRSARWSAPATTRCWPRSSPTAPTARRRWPGSSTRSPGHASSGVTTTTRYLRALLARPRGPRRRARHRAHRSPRRPGGAHRRRGRRHRRRPCSSSPTAPRAPALIRSIAWTAGAWAAHAPHRIGGSRSSGGDPVDVTVPHEYVAMVSPLGDGRFAIEGRGEWLLARDGDVTWIGHGGSAWPVRPASAVGLGDAAAGGDVRAPMPGQVLLVHAAAGDRGRPPATRWWCSSR